MSENQTITLISIIGCMVLVGSSLAARRIPFGQTLKMALAWVAIFGILFVIVALRDDLGTIGQKLRMAALGNGDEVVGNSLRIPISEDGHYYATAMLNGHQTVFLIDSGASVTTISREMARTTGVPLDDFEKPVLISTANGMAEARRSRVAHFVLGPFKRNDMPIHVMDDLNDMHMLGMDFLSSLKSWRVEGRILILEQ